MACTILMTHRNVFLFFFFLDHPPSTGHTANLQYEPLERLRLFRAVEQEYSENFAIAR